MESIKDLVKRTLLKALESGSKLTAKLYMPYSRKKIKAHHYHKARYHLFPGTIILSRTQGEFSNLVIPGKYSHVGIIATDGMSVIEAISEGVVKTDLIDFMLKKDEICIMRSSFFDQDEMVQVSIEAERHLGKPYDWRLVKGDISAFYCSELVYHCHKEVKQDNPFTLRRTFGKLTVAPSDFYNAKSKFYVVWKS